MKSGTYFVEYLKYYKNLSQNEIRSDILKLAKQILEMDEDSRFFVYFTPLVLSFADGTSNDAELEIVNIINEKYKLNERKVSAKDDPVVLGEYINGNLNTYFNYYFLMEENVYSISFIRKIFILMVQYMSACISLKKAVSNEDLNFLGKICKYDLTRTVEAYNLAPKDTNVSSNDRKEIIGPVTFKDLRFLLHLMDNDKKLITIESNYGSFSGIPFFYPTDDAGGMEEGFSLWYFLNNVFDSKNRKLHIDYLLGIYEISEEDFDQMTSFERALTYLLFLLEGEFEDNGLNYHINEIEKTIKYLEDNCRFPILIDKFKSHIIVNNNYEEFNAVTINLFPEDIENSITPTSTNLYLDVSSNTIDISDLFQVATANINKEFCIGQYMFFYHFKDGIQEDEYRDQELLNYSLTECEFDAFVDVIEEELKPKNIKTEKGLINWIISQNFGLNVLKYNGKSMFLKFSCQAFNNHDEDIEIENLKLFDPSLSPDIKIKLY